MRKGRDQRLRGRFYPSSRPPNGLPPRSCVIYVERALACFCPRQHSAFSRDPLSLPQPARHHRVEINKGSPGRVRAASLKLRKDFLEGLNNSTGKKRPLRSELRQIRRYFIFIFRKPYPLIRDCYLKTTMDHEKNGWGDFKWQSGGCLIDRMEDRWYVWGKLNNYDT